MPVDRGAIDAQLREIGEGERWWEQREFRELPHILHLDERIRGLVTGRLLGARRPRLKPSGTWLVVATDQRLIFLKHDRFARKQVDITSGQITRVSQTSRLRGYQISIETAHRKLRLRISKADAFRFAGAVAPLLPPAALNRLPPELERWAWLPGVSTVAALPGIAALISSGPAPEPVSRREIAQLHATVERLENDVDRLQQQVSFLEELLHKRQSETFLPGSAADA